MTRDDLFYLASSAGWKPGHALTPPQRAALAEQVTAALTNAPHRPLVSDGPNSRPMTADEALDALIEEIA